ncbi:hypothetical protein TI05_17575 [Achromatium sp. WMS3]|nr:hypothetical protein TI05_17575 [Achromatium sp. WMS3]
MQILKVEVEDSLVDKVLNFLSNCKGVTVEMIDKYSFLQEIETSEQDMLNGKLEKIEDVDKYIEDLENEIK